MSAKKLSTSTTWVDLDDAPELTEEFLKKADQYVGKKLITRGRPKEHDRSNPNPKRPVSVYAQFSP